MHRGYRDVHASALACVCLLAQGRVLLARFNDQQAVIRTHTLSVWLLRLRLLILILFSPQCWTRALHESLCLNVYLCSDGDESDVEYFSFYRVSILQQFSGATAHFANTLLHNLNLSLVLCLRRAFIPSEAKQDNKKPKMWTDWIWPQTDGQLLSEDCWGHTLSGRQDLPCPVRLKLPPSQSASELQLCLPWSCYTQETGVRVWTRLVDVKKAELLKPEHNGKLWKQSFASVVKFCRNCSGLREASMFSAGQLTDSTNNYPITETVLEWDTISVLFSYLWKCIS